MVFDGHGPQGTECARHALDHVPKLALDELSKLEIDDEDRDAAVATAFRDAYVLADARLDKSKIDDAYSGTTAISLYVDRGKMYATNVGDSRTMLGYAAAASATLFLGRPSPRPGIRPLTNRGDPGFVL